MSPCNPSNWESGDPALNRESPPLAGFYVIVRSLFPDGRTGWLGREDSNSDIPDLKKLFEMSAEFRTFPENSGSETFAAISCVAGAPSVSGTRGSSSTRRAVGALAAGLSRRH
jgi:hypothetical protein